MNPRAGKPGPSERRKSRLFLSLKWQFRNHCKMQMLFTRARFGREIKGDFTKTGFCVWDRNVKSCSGKQLWWRSAKNRLDSWPLLPTWPGFDPGLDMLCVGQCFQFSLCVQGFLRILGFNSIISNPESESKTFVLPQAEFVLFLSM